MKKFVLAAMLAAMLLVALLGASGKVEAGSPMATPTSMSTRTPAPTVTPNGPFYGPTPSFLPSTGGELVASPSPTPGGQGEKPGSETPGDGGGQPLCLFGASVRIGWVSPRLPATLTLCREGPQWCVPLPLPFGEAKTREE